MTRIRAYRLRVAVGIAAMLLLGSTTGTCTAQDRDDDDWEVRVYRVTDLILPRPDYPYDGSEIPTTGSSLNSSSAVSEFGGGFGGGGSGGFGGGGGTGYFQVSDGGGFGDGSGGGGFGSAGGGITTDGDSGPRFSMDDLVEALQVTIEPGSWDIMGGEAVCTPLGSMLIIKQTTPVHSQIDALLTAIRDEGGGVQTVTLQAHWLLLSAEELDQLVTDDDSALALVDRDALQTLSGSRPGYQGRITCFGDQTVHLVSGQRRSTVVSAIPVAGMDSVGYQPIIALPNIGVLLEIKPTLLPNEEHAILNLVSTVTSAGDETETTVLVAQTSETGNASLQLDRLSLDTQRLATTVRVPLEQPVLVGGLSMAGTTSQTAQEQQQRVQLYLIVELTADTGEE